MSEDPTVVATGNLIAGAPYFIGYPPENGVAILGFAPEPRRGHARMVGSAFIRLEELGPVPDFTRAAAELHRAFSAEHSASILYVIGYTDNPDHDRIGEDVANLLRLEHSFEEVSTFVVSGDQYRETTPGSDPRWRNIPDPDANITDHYASPAPSRDEILDRVKPHREPTYRTMDRNMREYFRTLPPLEAATHIVACLDHPDGFIGPGGAQRAAQASYLLTRDLSTRDVALASLMSPASPQVDLQRLEGLIELARGCEPSPRQQELYSHAAFVSYAYADSTPRTEGLLRQVTTQQNLADITQMMIGAGKSPYGMREYLAHQWESPEFQQEILRKWTTPPSTLMPRPRGAQTQVPPPPETTYRGPGI